MTRKFKGTTHETSLCGRVHRALESLGAADIGTIAATLGEDRRSVQKAVDSLKFRGIAFRVPSQYTLTKPPEEPKGVTVVKIKARDWFEV